MFFKTHKMKVVRGVGAFFWWVGWGRGSEEGKDKKCEETSKRIARSLRGKNETYPHPPQTIKTLTPPKKTAGILFF